MTAPTQTPVPISITICGDGGCGKSSITLRLVRSQWTSDYDPTIEDSYSVTRRIDGVTYHLSLTDTAGQEEYRETRLDNADRARRAGLRSGHDTRSRTIPPVKLVAGNKCDLQESRQVPAAQGLEWARKRGCGFMETSARLEVNIEETFALVVRRVVEARRLADTGPDAAEFNARGMTKPLTPLPTDSDTEKRAVGVRGPNLQGDRVGGKKDNGFWKSLRCW
ncbi:Ras-like protein rasC [Fusarium oxysporum f. sp. raphani]|uniref:Ras-like protein rasC n=1 Tax=Fusarium oxysporum f. sp. raphani TaxID=96318 RepID=A0A8J5UGQ3_FUSOX|nr:Ras-like protein rasC [Fusarium oxysporum f. sp. raphani]